MLRNITKSLRSVVERSIAKSYETKKNTSSNGVSHEDTMVPLPKSLNMELEEAARELKKKQISELDKLKGHLDFQQYAIKGDDDQWNEALKIKDSTKVAKLISVKTGEKRSLDDNTASEDSNEKVKKKKKHKEKKNKV